MSDRNGKIVALPSVHLSDTEAKATQQRIAELEIGYIINVISYVIRYLNEINIR